MNAPAVGFAESSLDLNEHLIEHREATFLVRVRGESMSGAGLGDGDLLVVDRALAAADGDLVVALDGSALTLKRLRLRNGSARLLPDNPCFRPAGAGDDQDADIWGVVTGLVRRLRRPATR